MPAPAAPMPITLLTITYAIAFLACPACIICTVSTENVEKVVKDPQKPVPINSFMRGGTGADAATAPRTKLPATLIAATPHGFICILAATSHMLCRAKAPTTAPVEIARASMDFEFFKGWNPFGIIELDASQM
eukprot:CAMPEP_0177739592 /NCGR_PEP_ID=MMETSP0484_2-20121128/27110_1 /TAXON_ID=354590 /ORGANISM="Rhodomonas lens, Strain RHODO" /LENGTH=132 /DNA_ID=CAMNT_0019253669 /DNA_START=40 /DNA_END=438 /DNA_ORIENTATION=+